MANLRLLPDDVQKLYEVHEWRNASAVLHGAHPKELNEILSVLRGFRLIHADIMKPGGSKSDIAGKIDQAFYALDWYEKRFDTSIRADEEVHDTPTHGIDCYKNGVALEVEWNNKDPFLTAI